VRAVQITEFGGPEVLRVVDLPDPERGPDDVLVRVLRAGVNFADTHQRTNSYVAQASLPLIPGAEVAGVLEGSGERVVAMCGVGGYAELVAVPRDRVFPIPDGLDDDAALALFVPGLTAWHLYRTCARIDPAAGDTVVVGAASGGVGSIAVQLGRPLGAGRVIALASSEEKRALAVELGADAAVDSAAEGLTERVLEANEGRPVDVVFEMVGGEAFDAAFAALAPLGRIVVCGIASREQNEIRTGKLLRRSWSVVGFWLFHLLERPGLIRVALDDLFARAARGELRTVPGGVYPLSRAAEAHEALKSRSTTGKLTLDPAG
jgi:NADPH2:quinone reductase